MPIGEDGDLRTRLTGRDITAITVDTSIFDEKKLRLDATTLRALSKLGARPFDFILSGTVAREVEAHLSRAAEEAMRATDKALRAALAAFDTHAPERAALLAQVTGGRTPAQTAARQWEDYVAGSGCQVLDDADLVPMATIYDAYFAGDPPFGAGRKKDEFPDALALHALEATARARRQGILVVSKDGDWWAFCERSRWLHLVPQVERALALVADAPLELRGAIHQWMTTDRDAGDEIGSLIAHQVQDFGFVVDADADGSGLLVEASAWDGTLLDIAWPDEADLAIMSLEDDGHGLMKVVVSLPTILTVSVDVELTFEVWDGMDREAIDLTGRRIKIEQTFDMATAVTLDVHHYGTADEEILLEEVELEDRFPRVELGVVNPYGLD